MYIVYHEAAWFSFVFCCCWNWVWISLKPQVYQDIRPLFPGVLTPKATCSLFPSSSGTAEHFSRWRGWLVTWSGGAQKTLLWVSLYFFQKKWGAKAPPAPPSLELWEDSTNFKCGLKFFLYHFLLLLHHCVFSFDCLARWPLLILSGSPQPCMNLRCPSQQKCACIMKYSIYHWHEDMKKQTRTSCTMLKENLSHTHFTHNWLVASW